MVSIEQRMQIAAPIQRCFDLSRSIEVHLLGTERTGERAVSGVTTGLIGLDESVRWRAKHLGVRQHLTSRGNGEQQLGRTHEAWRQSSTLQLAPLNNQIPTNRFLFRSARLDGSDFNESPVLIAGGGRSCDQRNIESFRRL
jgi:hypothetical protein